MKLRLEDENISKSRDSVEDDKRSGRPQNSHIEKISAGVHKNRLQTIAESARISLVTCQRILTKDLKMHRVCQHMVLRMLNEQSAEVKSATKADLKDVRAPPSGALILDYQHELEV
ncbi:hypothetical protein TNCV_486811 [Trichonephila clavipes]|nr:hypothetical protein TNCV_486811 [Trichonephila clavipes]